MSRLALRIEDCRRAIQVRYRIERREMLGPRQFRRIAWPRQVAMVLAHDLTGASTTMIGRHFGGRHHTTVLHAKNRVAERADGSHAYRQDVEDLRLTLAVYRAQIEQAGWP